jgi:hypothetical protein
MFHSQTELAPKEPLRESFMNRLKTFSVLNWCGKPIDPPTCAQHGWQISDDNVLKCTMCKQVLSVDLPSPSKRQPCEFGIKAIYWALLTNIF